MVRHELRRLFDYQSDRHCSKTANTYMEQVTSLITSQIDTAPKLEVDRQHVPLLFDYQSDRHCSKTRQVSCLQRRAFDYQSDRHCSKTRSRARGLRLKFDYQSDRHCSKTLDCAAVRCGGLITSQIDTAPKRGGVLRRADAGLITSQIDTAPKRALRR